jgi:hypothetical protein
MGKRLDRYGAARVIKRRCADLILWRGWGLSRPSAMDSIDHCALRIAN